MAIRAVIVDDEKTIVQGLSTMLSEECPQVTVQGTASNLVDARELLRSKAIDLVFLDVKIGSGNGFQLLKELAPVEFQVIFITGYDEYAVEAFRFSAIDFLLKPIDPDELKRSVMKAEKVFYAEDLQLRLRSLLYNYQNSQQSQTIVLKTVEAYHVVKVKEIVQCEAHGNYTLFHLMKKKNILVSLTLKKFDLMLSKYNFFRCHQSHLVNMDSVVRFEKRNGGSLILNNGDEIPVSTRRKEQLFSILSE